MNHQELVDYYESLTYQEFFNFSANVVKSYSDHIHIKRTYNLPLSREEEIILEFIFRQEERNHLELLLIND
jgi:hypothetical protein